jgi:protein-S-isoprenylcysteine O-methyltransferase Ste14
VLAFGIGLMAFANRTLVRHKTPINVVDPTTELVTDGPYNFSRNPIYLSFALIYLGATFILNSLPALIILVPVVIATDRNQILREERYLEAKFTEEYHRYKSKVRRWI